MIDKHEKYREDFKKIIANTPGVIVIGEGHNATEAYSLYKLFSPDIIVMEVDVSFNESIDVIRNLKKDCPEAKIIALTYQDDELFVIETIKAGVNGYILKESEPHQIRDAIKQVMSGHTYIIPQITHIVVKEYSRLSRSIEMMKFSQASIQRPKKLLSNREYEVLQLLTNGQRNQDIAKTLFISEKTVKNHVSSILRKLNVVDRTQAVMKGIKNGWVEIL